MFFFACGKQEGKVRLAQFFCTHMCVCVYIPAFETLLVISSSIHQGGYVFVAVCLYLLSVCLSVINFAQKLLNGFV